MSILHLPTYALLIGYAVYWLELYVIGSRPGVTTPLAWICLSTIICVLLLCGEMQRVCVAAKAYIACGVWAKIAAAFAVGLLLIAGWALTYPVHLGQEYDALNYHLTLPRQHLVTGSFAHLSWSSADLFLMPLQYAIAPYALVSEIPNKIVFFLFVIGLFAVVIRFANVTFGCCDRLPAVALVLTSLHALGIQMSTAMFDISIAYLFFASIDSWRRGDAVCASAETAFLVFAKPFNPLLFSVLGVVCWGYACVRLGRGKIVSKRLVLLMALFSCVIAGPFAVKSLAYAGTPLYPFAPFSVQAPLNSAESRWELEDAARMHGKTVDAYGYGKGPLAFLAHPWLLAVPEKGVNNAYDYPAGLPVLLCLPLFFGWFVADALRRRVSWWYVFAVAYWLLWWFGSQQTRFAYVPMIVITLAVIARLKEREARVFTLCLAAASLLNVISVLRSNLSDFKMPRRDTIRAYDRRLMGMGDSARREGDAVTVATKDAAYACFAIDVADKDGMWVVRRR